MLNFMQVRQCTCSSWRYSSKFSKWGKIEVLCPKESAVYNFIGHASCTGVAYNGMLYWPTLKPNGVRLLASFVGIDAFKKLLFHWFA